MEKFPTREIISTNEIIEKELEDLGIEAKRQHIEAVLAMKNTSNFPAGFEDIAASLGSPDRLKILMREKSIHSIVHSEGGTVWDHVRTAILRVNELPIGDDEKRKLKLIMLYHDLGKVEVWAREENIKRTQKHLEQGGLHVAMIGHEKARTDEIRAGLQAAGIGDGELKQFTQVILNHMNTEILIQDPKKTYALVSDFGESEQERETVMKLLVSALTTDGSATEKLDLVGDELVYTKNELKSAATFEDYWGKYEEGKRMVAEEAEKLQAKARDAQFEKSVLDMSAAEYLKIAGIKDKTIFKTKLEEIKSLLVSAQGGSDFENIKKMVDEIIG